MPFQVLVRPEERDGMGQRNAVLVLGQLQRYLAVVPWVQLDLPSFPEKVADQHCPYGERV